MKEKIEVESSDGHIKKAEYDDLGIATINVGLQQLEHFREIKCSNKPEELEWEIRVYKWILAQPDAKEKADLYLRARMPGDGRLHLPPRDKRAVVKDLGWDIK